MHVTVYDLLVGDFPETINSNSGILLSRNTPVALIIGTAGFVGSHLAEKLLDKGIQVVGIDDLSTGRRENLEKLTKEKKFHFINQSVDSPIKIHLPRLDYAFFVADTESSTFGVFKRRALFTEGVRNFLDFIKEYKPKTVFASSISLYDNKIPASLDDLKSAEINLAKFAKEHQLNARIVRLAPIYGPRMHFREEDPIIRLINAALRNEIQKEQTSQEFSTRALYFYGGTAQKIYDGALLQPIKVTEIKQILLDPLWHEQRGFSPSELPPWTTPNLKKTAKELSWKPHTPLIKGLKETIAYFKENNIDVSEPAGRGEKKFSSFFGPPPQTPETKEEVREAKKEETKKQRGKRGVVVKVRQKVPIFLVMALILYALVFPVISLGVGAFSIRTHLKNSAQDLQSGDFEKATAEVSRARDSLRQLESLMGSLSILQRLNLFNAQIDRLGQLVAVLNTGVDGVNHATAGTEALFKTTKVISGEDTEDPKPLYNTASLELQTSSQEIAQVRAKLSDQAFLATLPTVLSSRIEDFQNKLVFYSDLVEKARVAATLMPSLTAVEGKKSYLVLLENNLELRGSGGFIGSYAQIDFEGGRVRNIKVDDIYNLDGNLKDHIEPPPAIKSVLGQNNYYLRDSNFEPDFPTSARLGEFFYNKEVGMKVNGVIAMDLSASGELLNAVGGVDLPDYSEHVDGTNLFQKAITHAEVNFFPGSQAKKNYLTSLESQLFNKVFFLSKQNWPGIIEAFSQSLSEKHLMVYLDDPSLFSYLSGENWSGILPRAAKAVPGQNNDFLAMIDTNLGANKANYYLDRSFDLQTNFGKEGEVSHHLQISYKNNSPTDVFPAGTYKNYFRIYLPIGAKLTKAAWGDQDITKDVTSFSDYGRSGFSMLIPLNPKEQKVLTLDYTLGQNLSFADSGGVKKADYRLDVLKQAGTDKDPLSWSLAYPINFKLTSISNQDATSADQQVNIATDLQSDRSFFVQLSQ
jgi:nucleoside-diphosphate-sugar epimerase